LRELIWRFSAVTYFQFMLSGNVAAAIFNAQRTKQTDKVFRWTDFHPSHHSKAQKISGPQLMAQALAMAGDCDWDFAPGMTLEKIIGGQINGSESN